MLKKTKLTKVLASICAMAMLTGSLVGCGSKTSQEPVSNETTKTTKTATEDKKDASSGKNEVTTIKFAVWDYGTTDYWAKVIEAFEAQNPQIKVEPIDIPSADYPDKVTIMLASGDDTDVITIKTMPTYASMIDKKQIVPLDEYISKDKIDMAPYAGIDESIKVDGNLYGVPFRSDYWLLYYNKNIFDAAGIPYPTNNMTWAEYRDIANKLTQGTGNDKVYGGYTHTWLSSVVNWAYTDGKNTLVGGNYDFLKPAYELALGMQNEDKSTMEWGELKTANIHYSGPFYKEQVAMLPMGSWFINSIINTKSKGETNVNWGFTQVPHFDGQGLGQTIGNVTPMSINSNSKNKEAAWEFIKFMCTEPGAKVLADLGTLPAYKTPEVIDSLSSVDGFPKECKDDLNVKTVTLEIPAHPQSAAIEKILNEEHELIMLGANSVDDGIGAMNKRIQEILSK